MTKIQEKFFMRRSLKLKNIKETNIGDSKVVKDKENSKNSIESKEVTAV